MSRLFENELKVINVGLESFHDSILDAGGNSIHIQWTPPGLGDAEAAGALASALGNERLAEGNAKAHGQYLAAQPVLRGLEPARDVLDNLGKKTILHAGPPIEWNRMCGPMKGAVIGAAIFEGWAEEQQEAEDLAASGAIEFSPCHHFGAVGPMAGIISPSMDLWVVENADSGNEAFSNMNEGLGKVLRFGANSEEVITRLRWMNQVHAPAFRAALKSAGGIELKPMMAQALHMGDEVHNRNAAASALFLKTVLPLLLQEAAGADLIDIVNFINGNDHFFLNISMAACKSMLDAAHGVPNSSMVTAMSRNGVDFGIRVSGAGDRWFTAPAPLVDGLYFPGYSKDDGAPDLGDSAITETAGLGGFAMAAAPAIVQFVGGSAAEALQYTEEMAGITLGSNPAFTLPPLDFIGTPAGIDVLSVVDSGIAPIINTGIAHKEAGIGQVGAGITRAPIECFAEAIKALEKELHGKA
ncbi:MAG: DUF1116 domain-containing protein [Spirochaetales bacterium]|jgi:hypothetical protein|nr:DUF1116 domain-containing protein [Spirochaetales bacterium]